MWTINTTLAPFPRMNADTETRKRVRKAEMNESRVFHWQTSSSITKPVTSMHVTGINPHRTAIFAPVYSHEKCQQRPLRLSHAHKTKDSKTVAQYICDGGMRDQGTNKEEAQVMETHSARPRLVRHQLGNLLLLLCAMLLL